MSDEKDALSPKSRASFTAWQKENEKWNEFRMSVEEKMMTGFYDAKRLQQLEQQCKEGSAEARREYRLLVGRCYSNLCKLTSKQFKNARKAVRDAVQTEEIKSGLLTVAGFLGAATAIGACTNPSISFARAAVMWVAAVVSACILEEGLKRDAVDLGFPKGMQNAWERWPDQMQEHKATEAVKCILGVAEDKLRDNDMKGYIDVISKLEQPPHDLMAVLLPLDLGCIGKPEVQVEILSHIVKDTDAWEFVSLDDAIRTQ